MGLASRVWAPTWIKLSETVSTAYALEYLTYAELNPFMIISMFHLGFYPSLALSLAVYHLAVWVLVANWDHFFARLLYYFLFGVTLLVALHNLTLIAINL